MSLDDLSMTDLTSQPGVMTPNLRPLDFEAFPAEIRLKIYRLLLLKISNLEGEDEYEADSGRINNELILDRFEEGAGLYPVIMRLNKRIHSEAAPVFWGENYFTWSIYGDKCRPMWHYDLYGEKSEEKTQVTRKYSRLITRMRIVVNLGGDDNDPTQKDAVYMTRKNLNDACAKLSLNDLKFLEVRFCNGLTGHPSGRFRGVLYYGQTCLEPLKKLRAEKVKGSLLCCSRSC